MTGPDSNDWEKRIVSPADVLKKIEPGMSIFIGTGVAEPRTLVKSLMTSDAPNLQDLELIQLISLGDTISINELRSHKYRLKTFFSGWVASEAITAGHVDLVPSRFSRIPRLIETKQIPIDVAFVQVTPPNEAGYCSLGVSVDVTHQAIEQASLLIGEINTKVPQTFGDTFVHVSTFDMLIRSADDPIYFPRWPKDDIFDKVAANVASVIEDGSCIAFSIGPLFESLGTHLSHKRNLGVHSPFITDALMDLIKSGAVTNRNKDVWRGKSLVSYAFGTKELMTWLDRNPLVEFQGVDKAFNPIQIGKNSRFVLIFPARRVDLSGKIALHFGKGNVSAGPGETMDFFHGADISDGGLTIIALTSRNRKGEPNIRLSVENMPNQLSMRESIDMVVTEYGVADMNGRTVRERAQALIELAHPDDRKALFEQAKKEKIIYQDQIFLAESSSLYPSTIFEKHIFKGGLDVRFRAIKPSDEDEMRRLFYRFSDEAVYYRYFSPIKTMPHSKMQGYVNINYSRAMSIVGLIGEPGQGHIIAEARFVKNQRKPTADVAFVVDEQYHGHGIATFLTKMLIRLARERGLNGFTADVLSSNTGMMKVFEKCGFPVEAKLEYGSYHINIPFTPRPSH